MKYEIGSRSTDKKAKDMEGKLNYYDLLEVSPKASQAVIASAYRTLCRRYHPDKNSGDKAAGEMMAKLNIAYGVLSDELKRKMYDEELVERQGFGKKSSVEVKERELAAGVPQPAGSDSVPPRKFPGSSAAAAAISWGGVGWVVSVIVALLAIYLIGQRIEKVRPALNLQHLWQLQHEEKTVCFTLCDSP